MARGWESKGIAAQQELAAEARLARAAVRDDRQQRRNLLEQQKTRLMGELQRACAPRMRGLIESELAVVNQRLADLN
jgi:hypothetical protein